MQEINLTAKLSTGGSVPPVINELSVTRNGTYTAGSDVDGFSPVIVDVPQSGGIIESKTITENGTYTPGSGVDGFSPVVVNVPLPSNAYLLKSVTNLPQAIASFNDGADAPMKSLKVAIEPIQEGSGDPSPTNIRPFSGWDDANITVADDDTDPTVSNVYTIDLDGTRYGGELDVVNGFLIVTDGCKKVEELSWIESSDSTSTHRIWRSNISGKANGIDNMISESYKITTSSYANMPEGSFRGSNSANTIFVCDSNYTTASDFSTSMKDMLIVYELATPQTIQLTPTAVKSLRGVNNVYANTGDIKDAEYFSK